MLEFIAIAAFIGLGMLIWDCIEVGRNDAANLVNAVFGSRVMSRQTAVYLAGVAVVLGQVLVWVLAQRKKLLFCATKKMVVIVSCFL